VDTKRISFTATSTRYGYMEGPCANMSDPCEWLCYYEFPISSPYGEPLMNVSIRFERFCCLRQLLRERIAAVTVDPLRDEIELRRLLSAFFYAAQYDGSTSDLCPVCVHRRRRLLVVQAVPRLIVASIISSDLQLGDGSRAMGHHVFVRGWCSHPRGMRGCVNP